MTHAEPSPEPTLQARTIYAGRIIRLEVHTVRLPDGKTGERELIFHPGAVAILALTTDERMIFVRQYRKALERQTWEIPAGKLEPGEDPLSAAQRELLEETGYTAKHWEKRSFFYTAPGFCDEGIHLYQATELSVSNPQPDADEFVAVHPMTREEARSAVHDGRIIDAKTLLALSWWLHDPSF